MKVFAVSPYYDSHGGGIEIVAKQLVHHLESNFDVQVIWSALEEGNHPLEKNRAPLSGMNIIENKIGFPYPLISFGAMRQVWKHVKESDIVHIHDYIYFVSLMTWFFCKLKRKPIVITQHIGDIPYKNRFLRKTLSFVNKTLGRVVLQKADRVVFISHKCQNYFQSICNQSPEHWHYIPNGVSKAIIKKLESHNFEEKTGNKILFVGRFVEKKGLRFLKKLAELTPDLDWTFVGKGPINPSTWHLPNVTVLQHVSQAELVQSYQKADLFVLPSVGEGFPLVIQEAVTCGIPVLTTDETILGCEPAQEFVFYEGIDSECSIEKWKQKIEQILTDQNIKVKVNQGKVFSNDNWRWESISERYWRIFNELYHASKN